ncbi:AfsR/SARP family transcriptional regulator [Kitasatospora viridis]|uniref:DNA-binding SARP family transcriptional activator n=1 Tax=Kitasatospora viridis TaxID=281105 RepID=A0A561UPV1_9ACTN|nr:BTAD domain-containing putative transcriptional regulator [Kitasatospora viridis]TWG01392.1 DNA-binding SARP family transcriptional activator [Kitasatospora viridis]
MDHQQGPGTGRPTAPAALRFGLLGPLTVHDDGGAALPVTSPKVRALLAMLLLEPGRVVSRDRLTGALWGEHPPATAATSLNNHVVQLRRLLGPDGPARLRTASPGYLLQVDPGELDSALFTELLEQARTARRCSDWQAVADHSAGALALWRGTPLSDLPGLAEEALPHVQQLQELRLQALEWQFDAELELGRPQAMIPALNRLTAEYPLREAFHRQLMLALHRTDQRAEALAGYQRLRRTLIEELGIEPGPRVRAAHQEILRAEQAEAEQQHEEAAAAPTVAAGAGLPRDVAGFTGRHEELEQLLAACRSGGPVGIVAVDGMPGVGKSALAVHAAHRLAGDYPDGQIFLPLHAHTPGTPAVEPTDALAALLLTIGVAPQQIPPDLDARANLWRSRLAGRRMLLLLDDARSSEQVRPLLPGSSGCLVLVTSRRRLPALGDAVPMTLGVLPPHEAAELFTATAGRHDLSPDQPAVTEVVRLCGCLPLAIHLTAARLRHRRAWTVADLVPDLAAAAGRLAALRAEDVSVAAAFDLSYRDLTPAQRRLFRRLGLNPGDHFDARAAAALDGTEPATARRLLEELEDHHLVDEPVRGRYRMHDLIREHSRALSTMDDPATRHAAVGRLLESCLATVVEAGRLLGVRRHRWVPAQRSVGAELPSEDAATAWLRTERSNLRAAIEYAATHGHPDYAVRLPAALHHFLRTQGHWSQARTLHLIALETARAVGDRSGEAEALTHLGTFQRLTGEHELAADHLRLALDLFRELDEPSGQAAVRIQLGAMERTFGSNTKAREHFATALELARDAGDRPGLGEALSQLGILGRITGEYAEATANTTNALALHRELGNRTGQTAALSELSLIKQLTGDLAGAEESLRQALELCRARDDRPGEAYALASLGSLQQLTGRYQEAEATHRRAGALYRGLGNLIGEANAVMALGAVRMVTGQYQAAEQDLLRASAMYHELDEARGRMNTVAYLGVLRLATDRPAAAAENLRAALALYRAQGDRLGESRVLAYLGDALQALGRFGEAERTLDEALALCRERGDRAGEAEVRNILGRLMNATGRSAAAEPQFAAALEGALAADSPLEQVRALGGLGRLELATGRTEQGTARLLRAHELAQRLGVPEAEELHRTLAELASRARARC